MSDEAAGSVEEAGSNFARSAVERITARIKQVEFAKKLAERGSYVEALGLLKKVREQYADERMQGMVDFMIRDYEKRVTPN